jgi:hypothetical protein
VGVWLGVGVKTGVSLGLAVAVVAGCLETVAVTREIAGTINPSCKKPERMIIRAIAATMRLKMESFACL